MAVYADYSGYDGKHSLNEEVCTIRWLVADVLDMMAHHGIALTDENLERVIGGRFAKTLQEQSIVEGWEIIDVLVGESF